MAEHGMFKTALRGFRKEDVLAYVDEMLSERSQKELELQGQIEQLQQQLAEAQVQQEAILENEHLIAEIAQLKEQAELLTAQVAEVTQQLEQERGETAAATMRDAELTEQLEQSHQAIAALWDEKAELQKQIDQSKEQVLSLRSLGEEFCRRVMDLLPEAEPPKAEEAPEEPVAAEPPIVSEPLVVDTPRAEASKPMERWLF